MRSKPSFRPMTLRNMRENGFRAVIATCSDCGHSADVNVDRLLETVHVSTGPMGYPRFSAQRGSRRAQKRDKGAEQSFARRSSGGWRSPHARRPKALARGAGAQPIARPRPPHKVLRAPSLMARISSHLARAGKRDRPQHD